MMMSLLFAISLPFFVLISSSKQSQYTDLGDPGDECSIFLLCSNEVIIATPLHAVTRA